MRICSISDTHGIHPSFLKACDILTISGDISPCWRDSQGVVAQRKYFFDEFIPVFGKLAKHVVFIAGNHDLFLERIMKNGEEDQFRRELPDNFHYLRDSSVTIDGIHFYGTPWTPTFMRWYFMADDRPEFLGQHLENIPEGIDFFLSHGPAYGYNDRIEKPAWVGSPGVSLGSIEILKAIRKARPKYLRVGHIHTGSHEEIKIIYDNDLNKFTSSMNVSVIDEEYEPTYTEICTTEV